MVHTMHDKVKKLQDDKLLNGPDVMLVIVCDPRIKLNVTMEFEKLTHYIHILTKQVKSASGRGDCFHSQTYCHKKTNGLYSQQQHQHSTKLWNIAQCSSDILERGDLKCCTAQWQTQ